MNISKIDHIVYTVPDFETALNDLEKSLGVHPSFGGHHLSKGTKNALLHLGGQCYLEILGIDEDNLKINAPRWMGVDLVQTPKITRWALLSEDFEKESSILQSYHPKMGVKNEAQRKTEKGSFLKWSMLLPLAKPEVEIIPFFINWRASSIHPTNSLAKKCQLVDIKFTHPNPSSIQSTFDQLGINYKIQKGVEISIKITIDSPNGTVEL